MRRGLCGAGMEGHSNPRSDTEYRKIAKALTGWYAGSKRELPWRIDRDPYKVWVSEIMLQQTRVEAVIGYFLRFMDLFPTVRELAAAAEQEVLKCWEGLGYYSRARHMHRAAKMIASQFDGIFPGDIEGIRSLPGVGPYTAGAIASIAYDLPEPAVDGNVLRVISRLDAIETDVLLPAAKADVTRRVRAMFNPGGANALTQGLMELGALTCLPGKPQCGECPLTKYCRAYASGRQEELPVRSPRKKQRVRRLRAGLFACGDGVLIAQRPQKGLLANLWEFPLVEKDDLSEMRTAYRDVYGIDISSAEKTGHVRHVFTHLIWEVDVYAGAAEMRSERCKAVPPDELDQYPMPAVFQKMKQWL
jgi:A/G-specific adenine glycosylase